MHLVLTSSQCRAVEARAVSDLGVSLGELMRRAGGALAAEVVARVPEGDTLVVCGPGNNGGDGWVAARMLHLRGRRTRVLSTVAPDALSGLAAEAAGDAVTAGVEWAVPHGGVPRETDFAGVAVVVDALLGTGSSLPLRETMAEWCRAIAACGAYVVSADVPTGVDPDTGLADDAAVTADATVTFMAVKRGLVLHPGAGLSGEIVLDDLGVSEVLGDLEGAPEVWDAEEYAALLSRPRTDAHKNDRGRVLIIAGSGRYIGAAVLAARGAMRMGAGYVTLAVPEPMVPVVQAHLLAAPVVGLPSSRGKTLATGSISAALDLAHDYDAVVMGPGLTLADGAVAASRAIVARLEKPLVIDADAINALVDAHELVEQRSAPTVLTPHPGELARLLGVTAAEVQSDRVSSSARLAGAARAVVLKGAGTVVSGMGRQVINTSGSFALATAGTGDVLAGVVGALLAQGLSPFEAGALGAYVHGRAGDAAAATLTPLCVTAEDVPDHLPVAVGELLEDW